MHRVCSNIIQALLHMGHTTHGVWLRGMFFTRVLVRSTSFQTCRQLEWLDLFRLPGTLNTAQLCAQFSARLRNTYGWRFYPLGILRFLADMSKFVGPIVLHDFLDLIESPTGDTHKAFLYAGIMCVAFGVGALCDVHYNLRVSKVQVAVGAAVMSSVFGKALKEFGTTGAVMNLMSTDCDRIINFCNSFHAFWSLPCQIALALYLLYRQVGLAFVAGLAFAILMIPFNKYIMDRVGVLSKEMMTHKDARVALMNEILAGIRVVKAFAWEDSFIARIDAVRALELKALKGRKYLDAVCVYLWATTPILISILTFTTYVLLGHELTAAKVFTSLSLFNILIGPLNAFPWVLNGLMEAYVSLKRVELFVRLPLVESAHDTRTGLGVLAPAEPGQGSRPPRPHLRLTNATFKWAPHDAYALRVPLFEVQPGELVVITGATGGGKTALLHALMREMPCTQGEREYTLALLDTGLAYASQQAWISHGTLRDNILCLQEYEPERYAQVVQACCLLKDFEQMPRGDLTEVGSEGHSLSGGQKARVGLARAAYQRRSLYLLDDPLAALDPAVASEVLERCILGRLREHGCVLCTHSEAAMAAADRLFVSGADNSADDAHLPDTRSATSPTAADEGQGAELTGTGKLLEEEKRLLGTVALVVYGKYWQAIGTFLGVTVLLAMLFMQSSRNLADWWLSVWVSRAHTASNSTQGTNVSLSLPGQAANASTAATDMTFYLGIYGGISGANTLFTLWRAFAFAYAGVVAARVLHSRMLRRVLGARVRFFDTNPLGRLVNRFSSDVYGVDDSLPFMLNILLAQLFSAVGTLVVMCFSEPYMLLVLLPLAGMYYTVQKYYRQTSREIKRLNSMSRSPIYAHFEESLKGCTTIRALQLRPAVTDVAVRNMESYQVASYNEAAISCWLSMLLQTLGLAILAGIAFLAAARHQFGTADAGLVGLGISYSFSITGILQGLVSAFTETEKEMIAVERVTEYDDVVAERLGPQAVTGAGSVGTTKVPHGRPESKQLPSPAWPEAGSLEFRGVCLRYAPNLALSLRDVSFVVPAGAKVGICGRTGAGKSSLFQVLLRMTEIEAGRVLVDGVNISGVPLRVLRRRVATIPQDPVLFTGTVRSNLDPFGEFDDAALWLALEQCHLLAYVRGLRRGLEARVEENGRNFSVGMRQLLCLGRALLRRCKVVCIDEATASVDQATDQLVQGTIRSAFASATVLTVAHRLSTILDSDLILVLEDGRVLEAGSPSELRSRSGGRFAQLLAHHDGPAS
ncbi:uncharacterized protein MONBRDRAFT_36370 [Monosiga brevicollis MX1]|uniref:ABC-type xenobiotic transporter n=1 Tax=Monosiga brevicollis TaxID=81824 RepID=A9UV88_MONBE|nr:uncharacterized protein MONBRDRAFT_36370 [Monosiga brevicollis MX1]EDQ90852.1 predicted protein [Monosiga brevicollis MX1]|eukprot:XP_001744149.1 hypothetical protein [Monosiga brevicollis MX1]